MELDLPAALDRLAQGLVAILQRHAGESIDARLLQGLREEFTRELEPLVAKFLRDSLHNLRQTVIGRDKSDLTLTVDSPLADLVQALFLGKRVQNGEMLRRLRETMAGVQEQVDGFIKNSRP